MDENKFKEAFADEAFMKNLLELDEPEDVISAFKAKGIELSIDDVMRMRDVIAAVSEGKELDELEDVAGGQTASDIRYLGPEFVKFMVNKVKSIFTKKW